MKLERLPFGDDAELISITDPKTGFRVDVSTFGATLVRVQVPDKEGQATDVNFGQDSPQEYLDQGGYLGAVTGRVANRISGGKFVLDGEEFQLPINQAGKNTLHGGIEGFNKKMWTCTKAQAKDKDAIVVFEYESADGEEGFPGTLKVTTTYTVSPNKVGWEFSATTDKPTIVNITNHAYWNLDGLDGLIDDLQVKVDASFYMPGDQDDLVTGEVRLLDNLPLDMREFKPFSQLFAEHGDIDNSFFVDKHWTKKAPGDVVLAGELQSPKTGRFMKIYTSEPIIHVYTGNYMTMTSFKQPCQKHGAVCFECQQPPNAINNPVFAKNVILRPGQKYYHKTVHEFGLLD
ncbi:MAG TPA: aldose epimerase family protein [Candidatus Lokiarchaeia archaeon]|nr:aldose epimerase family protein [Candidatus Lokiarchaeia archaeon]